MNNQGGISGVELIRLLFEGKWRFDVVRFLCLGPQRLSTLERLMPRASKKMLIDTLHSLRNLGWVVRSNLDQRSNRVEYFLAAPWSGRLRKVVETITVDVT